MLDLKTVAIVSFAISSLQAVAWLFVWQTWRHLYELRYLAASFAAIALGLFLMIMRGENPAPWTILLANTVIKVGLVLLAEGLARFLGQRHYSWVGLTLLTIHIIAWTAAIALDVSNVAIRIHFSTFFTLVMMSMMCLGLMRDRTQPGHLRWITIGFLIAYMVGSVVHSVVEQSVPAAESALVLANHNSWYLLLGALFQVGIFACLLFMVNTRLSTDLRDKNAALEREIQERRRLETQLNASLETERVMREEQTDFMRIVSHEFRTPLAMIRNATEMIRLVGDSRPQASRERLAGIDEALDRLFSVINRFMSTDRDNSFRPESMTLCGLMQDLRLHFSMTNQLDRLRLASADEGLPLVADRTMLSTVLINLVDNALKYSAEGAQVEVSVQVEAKALVLEVRDSGIGIPQDEQHKIGRRFFRASNASSRSGSGLGLYTSRKLLAYHNGTLELSANVDGGITATARVPLSDATVTYDQAEIA